MPTGIGIGANAGPGLRSFVFSPLKLDSISVWFDMSDASTVSDTGTTLTLTNKAADVSVNPTAPSIFGSFADKPTYVSGSHIEFAGQAMRSGTGRAWGANHTIFIVCGKNGTSGQEVFITIDGTNNEVALGSDSLVNRLTGYDGAGGGLTFKNLVDNQGALYDGTPFLIALRLTGNAGRLYINGIEQTGAANKTWSSSSRGSGLINLGAFATGNRTANNLDVYEVIICDETSDEIMTAGTDYLLAKHSI